MSGFLKYNLTAAMSNGLIPSLPSYVFIAGTSTTFDIELLNEWGQTISFYTAVACGTSATSLRALMEAKSAQALVDFDRAVGAIIKVGTNTIFYNTNGNVDTGVFTVAPTTASLRSLLSGSTYGIGWGS